MNKRQRIELQNTPDIPPPLLISSTRHFLTEIPLRRGKDENSRTVIRHSFARVAMDLPGDGPGHVGAGRLLGILPLRSK